MRFDFPSHGDWCDARTTPTRCPHCGAKVFFFTCDCGSKVFFDSLGWPWPVHQCYENDYDYDEDKLQETEAWLNRIHSRRQRSKRSRPSRASQRPTVRRDSSRRTKKPRKTRTAVVGCDAEEDEVVQDTGVVRKVVNPVNVYQRFDIPRRSRIGAGLLGPLAETDYAQVTVHLTDVDSNTRESYAFLVEQAKWNRLGAITGDLVSFDLIGKTVPTRGSFWLCDDISLEL